jgi:hypothetical protein
MPSSPATAATAEPILRTITAEPPSQLVDRSLPVAKPVSHRLEIAAAAIILLIGLSLRLLPVFGVPDRMTLDEHLYITNVEMLKQVGPWGYTELVKGYVQAQSEMEMVMLPPTRCTYILLGWAWDAIFNCGPRLALRHVAMMFSIFNLLLSGWFAFRLGGKRIALAVLAMMAMSPIELTMAHRELVDGVFEFWALLALWLLWENLHRKPSLGWLACYSGAIAVMVLTKENAAFAAVGLGGIQLAGLIFPKLNIGKVQKETLIATVAGGVLGALVLLCLSGGPETLIATYKLLVTKAEKMAFAYDTGGGPWFRYVVDLMLVSPAVTLPAIGGIFALKRENREGIFLFLFIVFSCVIMVNVKNGMNLRYATMWDMPLRFLAAGPLLKLAGAIPRWPTAAAVMLVGLVCGIELHQYFAIFVQHDLGEPVTGALMQILEIVRSGPAR